MQCCDSTVLHRAHSDGTNLNLPAPPLAHPFLPLSPLQASYLTWGALQERIMSETYGEGDQQEKFKITQFLVFVNRILAFVPRPPP